MVIRDRNHPSVIMWSIGNEIPNRATTDGVQLVRMSTCMRVCVFMTLCVRVIMFDDCARKLMSIYIRKSHVQTHIHMVKKARIGKLIN